MLDLTYDSELPLIIYDTFKNLGFKNITINLNNRKILNGLFNELNIANIKDDVLDEIISKNIKHNKRVASAGTPTTHGDNKNID